MLPLLISAGVNCRPVCSSGKEKQNYRSITPWREEKKQSFVSFIAKTPINVDETVALSLVSVKKRVCSLNMEPWNQWEGSVLAKDPNLRTGHRHELKKHGSSLAFAKKEIKMADFHQRFTPSSSSTIRNAWSASVGGHKRDVHWKKKERKNKHAFDSKAHCTLMESSCSTVCDKLLLQ